MKNDSIQVAINVAVNELKKHNLYGHSFRVACLAKDFAEYEGVKDLESVYYGGLIHDIGKIFIPTSILDKPGKLTSEEFNVVKQHPVLGRNFLESIGVCNGDLLDIVEQHHRLPTGGYPKIEKLNDLCVFVQFADVFDALISKRAYKEAMDVSQSLKIIDELFAGATHLLKFKQFIA